jgi:hypothetical protein
MLNEWKNSGKATSKGLAYMKNCYLVAYNTNYAINVEDYIELVTTTGATIPCFVAGAFNDSNTPIKFYRDPNDSIDLRDWASLTLKSIKNFGERA